jgi:hypothetical protein
LAAPVMSVIRGHGGCSTGGHARFASTHFGLSCQRLALATRCGRNGAHLLSRLLHDRRHAGPRIAGAWSVARGAIVRQGIRR